MSTVIFAGDLKQFPGATIDPPTAPPASFFLQHAATIKKNGYDPIPLKIGEKRPSLNGWPNYKFDPDDIDKYASGGVGILAARTPAIDIDVRDAAIVAEIEAVVRAVLRWPVGVTTWKLSPVRVGQAPKLLRPCQVDGAPFKKRVTSEYRLPGDAPGDKPHKLEILGDGQQWVAFNIHPDTKQPYAWSGGDPTQILHGWLPLISEADADEIIRRVEPILAKHGTAVGSAPKATRIKDPLTAAMRKSSDTWFELLPDDQKTAEVRAIVATWTAEQATDRDHWFICIRSIADAVDRGLDRETGIDIATEFSQRSTGDVDTRDAVASKMFEGGAKSSIYAAAAVARKSGYKLPANRVAPPPSAMPAPADGYLTLEDRTDKGNANVMIRLAGGNIRYIPETDQWIRWTGQRWEIDEHETFVMTYALEVARVYLLQSQKLWAEVDAELAKFPEITSEEDLPTPIKKKIGATRKRAEAVTKWAAKCRNQTGLNNMITAARKTEGVPLSAKLLDRRRHLIGVENGVVDLKTCELIVNESRDWYITKRCPVAYKPNGPVSKRFMLLLEEVTGIPKPVEYDAAGVLSAASVGLYTPRLQMAIYLLRSLGYAITGEVREQTFFIWVGEGSNGKTIIFDILRAVLGDYAMVVPSSIFLQPSKGPTITLDAERAQPVLAATNGKRVVIAAETKKGLKLDTNAVKTHTGEGTIRARTLHDKGGEFDLTHKPFLAVNDSPNIDDVDPAIKGRIHSMPFDRRWNRPAEVEHDPELPDGDKELKAFLERPEELEGVLVMLVKAASEYYAQGLAMAPEVLKNTREYFASNDTVKRWLTEATRRCEAHKGRTAADLYSAYGQWCSAQECKMTCPTSDDFAKKLAGLKYEKKHTRLGNLWGVAVLPPEPDDAPPPTPPPKFG